MMVFSGSRGKRGKKNRTRYDWIAVCKKVLYNGVVAFSAWPVYNTPTRPMGVNEMLTAAPHHRQTGRSCGQRGRRFQERS